MMHFWAHLLAAFNLKATDVGLPTSTANVGNALTNTITLLTGFIGSLSVIFIIVGGLQIALGGGNPARLKQGRETIIFACVGLAIAIGAYGIVRFVLGYL
ncbi:MAG TPA: hypothetical protein VLI05_06030 [Candidatus Saccharimonadia bacterium]|nr:hypothetical protein [Candidatus Saccharimonadia bacterium]